MGIHQPCLHVVAQHGRTEELAKLLIEEGCSENINVQDELGDTPLHKAITSDHEGCNECILLLLQHGADITIENEKKETPLILYYRLHNQGYCLVYDGGVEYSKKQLEQVNEEHQKRKEAFEQQKFERGSDTDLSLYDRNPVFDQLKALEKILAEAESIYERAREQDQISSSLFIESENKKEERKELQTPFIDSSGSESNQSLSSPTRSQTREEEKKGLHSADSKMSDLEDREEVSGYRIMTPLYWMALSARREGEYTII